jgi:mono/diheme cytochrome c family protein
MTARHPRRLAVLLAGGALLAIVVPQCEPAVDESNAAEPTVILGRAVPAEPTFSGKPDQGAIASSSNSERQLATGPIRAAQGPAQDRPAVPDRAKQIPASSRTAASERTGAVASSATPIELYRASCLECHDCDGRGGCVRDRLPKVPDFTDATWHASRSDTELSRSILQGKGKWMPRMKEQLGSVDVKQMVSFVRVFQGGKQVVNDEPEAPAAPEESTDGTTRTAVRPQSLERLPVAPRDQNDREGSRLFQRFCAMCHGPDGRGTGMRKNLSMIPDFTRRLWQEGRSDRQLALSVLDGKGAKMPSFAGKLSREQARDLVTFIRTLTPSPVRPMSTATDDFEARLRQLNEEFEDLGRQIRALSTSTPQTPSSPAANPPRFPSKSNSP